MSEHTYSGSLANPETTPTKCLPDEVRQFIQRKTLHRATVASYERNWKHFKEFCVARGFEPLGAPFAAYEALVAAAWSGSVIAEPKRRGDQPRRSDPMQWESLNTFIKAAKWAHEEEGLTAAPYQPEFQEKFAELRDGYRLGLALAGRTAKSAKAATPGEVRALMSVDAAARPDTSRVAKTAITFLSLDTDLDWAALSGIRPQDVSTPTGPSGDVVLRVAPVPLMPSVEPDAPQVLHIPHQHRASSPGDNGLTYLIPDVCLACLLVDVSRLCHRDVPLVEQVTAAATRAQRKALWVWQSVVEHAIEGWDILAVECPRPVRRTVQSLGTTSVIRWDERLKQDAWRYAGARYGVLLHLQPEGFSRASAQTRFAVSWAVGMRSHSDAGQVRRCDVVLERSESGEAQVFITIPKSKTDQVGRGATLQLAASSARGSVAALAVVWTAVIDGLRNSDDSSPWFPAFTEGNVVETHTPRATSSWQRDLRVLQKAAGVSGLTPHSSRRGFAVTAAQQGNSFDDIRATMRLVDPKKALRYMADASPQADGPHTRLLEALAETSVPSGSTESTEADGAQGQE